LLVSRARLAPLPISAHLSAQGTLVQPGTWALGNAASMTERRPPQSSMISEIVISLPFAGLWLARNSPARRVPSHGTDLLGERYAIDFIAVDHRHRTADRRDWRTLLATEPAERFFSYGRPIVAPADGIVVDVHDGEIDHVGRRSQLTLVPMRRARSAGRLHPRCHRRGGDDGAAGRGLWQLWQLDPAARARASHGQPRPVHCPRRPDGLSALPRMASRREASPDQGVRPSGRGRGRRTLAHAGGRRGALTDT